MAEGTLPASSAPSHKPNPTQASDNPGLGPSPLEIAGVVKTTEGGAVGVGGGIIVGGGGEVDADLELDGDGRR